MTSTEQIKTNGGCAIAPTWGTIAGLAATAAFGAGCMYFMDPNRGSARRTQLADRTRKVIRTGQTKADQTLRDLGHRGEGLLADVRHRLRPEGPVSDRRLDARVRTRLGRLTAHPHAVRVMTSAGQVFLAGHAPANDIASIVEGVKEVPGVKGVQNWIANQVEPAPVAAGPATKMLLPMLAGVGSGILAAIRARV